MSLPSFSCITVTGGRTTFLEEAIACFVRQSHEGDSELIILNTCPEQQLEIGNGYDNVRIINLRERPKSLGEARNAAVAFAENDWCCVWDDDDLYLPNHISNFAKHAPGNDWLWQNKQFYMLGRQLKSIVQGSANVVAFSKAAWDKVGGYVAMNCGEDRQFVGKITTQTTGQRIELADNEVSFIYAWGQGVYHQSGLGDDAPGRATSWQRAEQDLKRKLRNGTVPTGTVRLEPKLLHDYEAMAKQFAGQTAKPAADNSVGSVGVVLLGRYGDIINILPVLRHIAESYAKPHLVISREFLSLLDGVSYVEPYPVDLPNDQLLPAIKLAEKTFKHVIVAQPWARDVKRERKTESYNMESWHMAGFGHKFHDPTWLPVFDRRNLAREQALFTKLDVQGKPMLLVKLDGSVSSPCLECPKLLPLISDRFGQQFNVVNLSDVRSERIFDLLGLFDRAACLVSVDTSLLHLAAASPAPFVALVNPQSWLGTLARGRCVARLPYPEAVSAPEKVIAAIGVAISCPNAELKHGEKNQ